MTSPQDGHRFAAIYQQNRDRVYSYAVARAGRQLAEEIVSEVFLIAWRRFAELPEPPPPWLLVTARNVVSRTRSFIAQSPALAISLLALVFALGGGAGYAATTAQPGTTLTVQSLPLVHHWHAAAHPIAQGEPAYAADGDVVYLSGWMARSKPAKGISGVFAVLPPGLRPTHQEDVTMTTFAGTTALVQITPDGQMFVSGPDAWQFMSLDGVTFTTNG